ncbi:DoxX family protein [Dinghuibacter silviterrae]|uniref:DoxX-like protein n=1 Tax=Dinghuibacter silviterrae TaxID=1539049 RepID=A0A4R8DVY1_9BACT|nr:DoxX family protein [Dinghuibacter silviterrae]TDX01557.1 DoxX-like protein [Dinghuibacter silviterrae]
MKIALWIAQALLFLFLLSGAGMKLLMPIDRLAAMMPWMGQVSPAFVHFTGFIDLLGAAGIFFPTLLNVKPFLTVWAAYGILVLMACAIWFHVSRGEGPIIAPNLIVAALAAFVAWGRHKA